MYIVAFNAGSSSLKFALFERAGLQAVLRGRVEAGDDALHLRWQVTGDAVATASAPGPDRGARLAEAALAPVVQLLREHVDAADVAAVGHRVVHGGIRFDAPVVIDEPVLAQLSDLAVLAPLHQPDNLALVRAASGLFPAARQIACFDTAFHRAHPPVADVYALPLAWRDAGVRRYGFHGLSYEYVKDEMARLAPAADRVAIAHLGSGASLCAVGGGRSMDCSMGFSVLDGLPMATRCGQIDPGVLLHLMRAHGQTIDQVEQLLYGASGLAGLSGVSGDMRVLEREAARGHAGAALAIDYFVARLLREIGAAAATLGGLDGLVFTGGIGEHAAQLRARVVQSLHWLGAELDAAANDAHASCISATGSRLPVYVIATDEELQIARACARLLAA